MVKFLRYMTGGSGRRYALENWGLELEYWTSVDLEADMGYIEIRGNRKPGSVARTDLSLQRSGILLDFDVNEELLGIELFLRKGKLRPETLVEVKRLLGFDQEASA